MVGVVTNNPVLVAEGSVDLAADTIALAIPYVPAGATKVTRALAKTGPKVVEPGTKIIIRAEKQRKVSQDIITDSAQIGELFEQYLVKEIKQTDEVLGKFKVKVEFADKTVVQAQLDLAMRTRENIVRVAEAKGWSDIHHWQVDRITRQVYRQKQVTQVFQAAFPKCTIEHAGVIMTDFTHVSGDTLRRMRLEGGYEVRRASEFLFDVRAHVTPCR